MTDPLVRLEDEMADSAAAAAVRLQVAQAWMRSADADLGALRRPTWGGVVDEWHRAAGAVQDSAEAVAAYEAFGR
jgi:hypothetical protein